MSADAAINRLSYAEARSSNAEALMDVVGHQRVAEPATAQGKTEDAQETRFADQTREARAMYQVDKTA